MLNPINQVFDEGQLFTMNTGLNQINAVNVRDIVSLNSMNKPNGIYPMNAHTLLQRILQSRNANTNK